jgi:hypothetical protein
MGGYKILHDYFFSFNLLFRNFTVGSFKCISTTSSNKLFSKLHIQHYKFDLDQTCWRNPIWCRILDGRKED